MEFDEYYLKFEKLQIWMINDLSRSTLEAKANFLVAMGIFNYIEILGSFYKGKSSNTKRFEYAFSELFSECYKEVYKEIKNLIKEEPYDCLRCGMTHEYLIKTYKNKDKKVSLQYTIYGVDDVAGYERTIHCKRCGIELLYIDPINHLRIYNPKVINDLNLAFENYKNKLIKDESDYREKFMQRCKDICLENFN
jgi:hypothetical protein